MKILNLTSVLVSFLCIAFFSCGPSQEQQEQRRTAIRDSIAKAVRDSIRTADSIKRVHNELIAEGRQKQFNNADDLVATFTEKLAKNVCPLSYESLNHALDSANATYNLDTKTYSIHFKSSFYGNVGAFDDNKQLHAMYGTLTIYGGAEPQVKVDSINSVLAEDESNMKAFGDLVNGLIKLDSLSKR